MRTPRAPRRTRRPVALVTGSAVRLGRAMAEELARRGHDLVLHVGSRLEEGAELARTLERGGARTLLVQADLGVAADCVRMFEAIDAFTPRLEVAINSASAFERAPFLSLTDEQLERMVAVNLLGPMRVCREAARRMGQGGHLINLLDIGGVLQAWRGFAHYGSAKAGLAMLTRILSLELAPSIRVNGIAPGTVLPPVGYSEQEIAAVVARIPLGRMGAPSDIVRALGYLLDAPFVTGEVMVVDGGRSQGTGGGNEVR